jgi:hypothetical protein
MEETTKEWPAELLVLVEKEELFDLDLIKSPLATHEKYDAPNNSRRKKKEEV